MEKILKEKHNISNDILYNIYDYMKPTKLNENIQKEIKSTYVFNLLNNLKYEHENDIEEYENSGDNIEPYLPFSLEYLVDCCLDHSDFNYYIKQLENYKNDIDTAKYFISVIKLVQSWEMNNRFYDDPDYDDYYESSDVFGYNNYSGYCSY